VKVVVVNEWHIECLVCDAQYYTAEYPRKGCRNCGRDALLITDNRVDIKADNRASDDREREVVGSHRNELTSET
tara:strand:+ start:215 stop:436 length:222 start_codon:yes stop_codon:yes gene_type:complete